MILFDPFRVGLCLLVDPGVAASPTPGDFIFVAFSDLRHFDARDSTSFIQLKFAVIDFSLFTFSFSLFTFHYKKKRKMIAHLPLFFSAQATRNYELKTLAEKIRCADEKRAAVAFETRLELSRVRTETVVIRVVVIADVKRRSRTRVPAEQKLPTDVAR